MAIYYNMGTWGGGSTTLAHDVRRAWKSEFDAAIAAGKTNWTVVEHDYTPSGATTQRTVIENSLGFVFILITSTNDATTTMQALIGESYTTPTLYNIGMGAVSGFNNAGVNVGMETDDDALSDIDTNPTDFYAGQAQPYPHGSYMTWNATAGQTAWTAHIEDDYAILSFNDVSTSKGKWLYVGRYTSLIENTALAANTTDRPFVLFFSTSSDSQARGQVVFVQSAGNPNKTLYNLGGEWRPGGRAWALGVNGHPADVTYIDKYSADPDETKVGRIFLSRSQTTIDALTAADSASGYGWLTGRLKGMYNAGSSLAAYGDTIIVNGNTYMYIGGTSKTNPMAGWALID